MSATLTGQVREKLGSRWARRLRSQGRVPASIQGGGKENIDCSLDEVLFLAARRNHQHLFDVELEGGGTETVLVNELQWDAFGDRILHVEFRRVERDVKTEAEVALEFVGHPKGGVLNHLVTHLAILALPAEIPDSIEVKVDELEIGHPLFARDIRLPEGVTLVDDPDTQVAVVVTTRLEEAKPAAEAEEAPAEVPATAQGAEPKEKAEED
jgi:large subunit ribosomal protein L25